MNLIESSLALTSVACGKCGLYTDCQSPFMKGKYFGSDKESGLMVIDARTTQSQDMMLSLTVGEHFDFVKGVFEKVGIDSFYYTTLTKCFSKKDSTTKQRKLCGEQFIWKEIKAVKPDLILLLGGEPLKYFFGSNKVAGSSGKVIQLDGYRFVSVYGINDIRSNVKYRRPFSKDMQVISRFLKNKKKLVGLREFTIYDPTDEEIIQNEEAILEEACSNGFVSVDLETTGLYPSVKGAQILLISLSVSPTRGVCYFWEDVKRSFGLFEKIKGLLVDSSIKKYGQNLKFDMLWLAVSEKIFVEGFSFDSQIAHYLLDERHGTHSLEQLCWEFGVPNAYKSQMSDFLKNCSGKREFIDDCVRFGSIKALGKWLPKYGIKLRDFALYNIEDSAAVIQLKDIFIPKLKEQGLEFLFEEAIKLSGALCRLEQNGAQLSLDRLESSTKFFKNEIELAENKIKDFVFRKFGIENFDVRSITVDLRDIFFKRLKLEPIVFTKTGNPSLNADALEFYAKKGVPIATKIVEFRVLDKILSTYLIGFKNSLDRKGRIHTTYKIPGTVSGRLASSDPVNLQNIPTMKDDPNSPYNHVKKLFVSRFAGGDILEMDYSQLELRVLSVVADDKEMQQVFLSGGDIHARTAEAIYKVPQKEVTPDQRKRAKTINFGLVYQMGDEKLADDLGISIRQAEKFRENLLSAYVGFARWVIKIKQQARTNGYVTNLLGRRRRFQDHRSSDRKIASKVGREAVNSPIQGLAADICNHALWRLHRRFEKSKLKSLIIMTVHDSIIFDVYPGEREIIYRTAKQIMENPKFTFMNVPLVVDCKVGASWGECKKFSLSD